MPKSQNTKLSVTYKGSGTDVSRLRDARGRFIESSRLIVDALGRASVGVLKQYTPVAEGGLRASTDYTIDRTHNTWRLRIFQGAQSSKGIPISLLAGYGRGPSHRVDRRGNPLPAPVAIISRWILAKGIVGSPIASGRKRRSLKQNEFAWAVSKSIGSEGTIQYSQSLPSYQSRAQPQIDSLVDEATRNLNLAIQAAIEI